MLSGPSQADFNPKLIIQASTSQPAYLTLAWFILRNALVAGGILNSQLATLNSQLSTLDQGDMVREDESAGGQMISKMGRQSGGVEEWRGCGLVSRSVSTPRSSNRTCGFPASGFRTKVISCCRPREVGCGCRQPYQPQRPVKVFVRITASSGTSDFMFPTQPLTQPMSAVSVHCAISFAHRSKAKVIAPTL